MAFYIGGLDASGHPGFSHSRTLKSCCEINLRITCRPESDIFHGFWNVFLLKFEEISDPHRCPLYTTSRILSHRRSKFSFFITFWKGSQNPWKISDLGPVFCIWLVNWFPSKIKMCQSHSNRLRVRLTNQPPVICHGVQATNTESHVFISISNQYQFILWTVHPRKPRNQPNVFYSLTNRISGDAIEQSRLFASIENRSVQ